MHGHSWTHTLACAETAENQAHNFLAGCHASSDYLHSLGLPLTLPNRRKSPPPRGWEFPSCPGPQVLVLAPLVMPSRAAASSRAGPPQWVPLPCGHSRSWTKGKVHRVGPMRTHLRCAHRSSVGGSRRPSPTPTTGTDVGNKCRGWFRIRCHWLDNYGRGCGVAEQSLAARDE